MPFSRWNADSLLCARSSASRASLTRSSKKFEYCLAGSTRSSTAVCRKAWTKALAIAAANCGSGAWYEIAITLDSRDGCTSSCFCSSVASQVSMSPLPWVASSHCWRTVGLSASLVLRTTRRATRSLRITSAWVARIAGDAAPAYIIAVTGSGL